MIVYLLITPQLTLSKVCCHTHIWLSVCLSFHLTSPYALDKIYFPPYLNMQWIKSFQKRAFKQVSSLLNVTLTLNFEHLLMRQYWMDKSLSWVLLDYHVKGTFRWRTSIYYSCKFPCFLYLSPETQRHGNFFCAVLCIHTLCNTLSQSIWCLYC